MRSARHSRILRWLMIVSSGSMLFGQTSGCLTSDDIRKIFVQGGNELVEGFFQSLFNAFVNNTINPALDDVLNPNGDGMATP